MATIHDGTSNCSANGNDGSNQADSIARSAEAASKPLAPNSASHDAQRPNSAGQAARATRYNAAASASSHAAPTLQCIDRVATGCVALRSHWLCTAAPTAMAAGMPTAQVRHGSANGCAAMACGRSRPMC